MVFASEFPKVLNLSSLTRFEGLRLEGELGIGVGRVVASAGDVNGDGFADIILSAPYAKPAGRSYVVFGKGSPGNLTTKLSSLDGKTGFQLHGGTRAIIEECFSGCSVASAGDINGDGFDDVIVGNPSTRIRAGTSYVVFGRAAEFSAVIDLTKLNGTDGFKLLGVQGADQSGEAVAGAGDINGDGLDDLIIGAVGVDPGGSSYVVFGRKSPFRNSIDLAELDGKNGFRIDGASAYDSAGSSVASAGDVNGDGIGDIVIGASGANAQQSGSSYIIFGKTTGFDVEFKLSRLNGKNGFALNGQNAFDDTGVSVAGAGDINGDGLDDVIVGAFRADANGLSSGSSYVVFGRPSGSVASVDLSSLNGGNGFRLDGARELDHSGRAVSGAGDINGDGFADLIIGANGYYSTGSAYVVFGKASAFPKLIALSDLSGVKGMRIDGGGSSLLGRSVAFASDINGDGFADILIGAPSDEPSGAGYVIYGRAPDTARTRLGSAADQYISGGKFADSISGLSGDDVIEGRKGADDIDGGAGRDAASYRHSPAAVTVDLTRPSRNTGDAGGDTFSSIEDLIGSAFDDNLFGNSKVNRITGGPGRDILNGGDGGDVFVFASIQDSVAGAQRDRIVDFDCGSAGTIVDVIDISGIDAKPKNGDQSFNYIGTANFHKAAGEVRVRQSGTTAVISGDVNGDAKPDFEIGLPNFSKLECLTGSKFKR